MVRQAVKSVILWLHTYCSGPLFLRQKNQDIHSMIFFELQILVIQILLLRESPILNSNLLQIGDRFQKAFSLFTKNGGINVYSF